MQQRENERLQGERVAATAKIEAEGKANAAREAARGEADAKLLVATAEAKSIQLKGEAEARAIEAQAKALAQSGTLVELRKAERWNGQLPSHMLSDVIPMLNLAPAAPASK